MSETATYEIVTSKSAVTVAQGGTGATTAADARTNLGAVNKAGDTMSGTLTTANTSPILYLKNTAADVTATTGTSQRGWLIGFQDKNDINVGFLQSTINTDGRGRTVLLARKKVNGSNVDNSMEIYVNADGTRGVAVTSPQAWLSALGLNLTQTTSASTVATAGSNITIQSVDFWKQGKVAQFNIVIKANANIASAATVFTLKSGYRPATDTNGTFADAKWMTIGTNGAVKPQSAISSGSTYAFRALFLLA